MSCSGGLIVLATILGPITLIFMAVSFGTDYWIIFNVDKDQLSSTDKDVSNAKWTHSRYQGLFRVCYPGNESTLSFMDEDDDVVDNFCYRVKYSLPNKSVAYSDKYFIRMHFLRLFLALYISALVFFIAAFIFGLVLCCWRFSRWAYLAGLFAYIAAFSIAAAIAFFHGVEYLERNKLTEKQFYQQWSTTIKIATSRSYGWSYFLGWVSMIFCALTATFYAMAGCYITSKRYEDRERLEKESQGRGRDYPMVMEPYYAMEDPYMMKPYGLQYVPAYPVLGHPGAYPGPMTLNDPRYDIGYGDSQRDLWQYREVLN